MNVCICTCTWGERGQGRCLPLSILLLDTGSPSEFRVYWLASWPAKELQEYSCLHPSSERWYDELCQHAQFLCRFWGILTQVLMLACWHFIDEPSPQLQFLSDTSHMPSAQEPLWLVARGTKYCFLVENPHGVLEMRQNTGELVGAP